MDLTVHKRAVSTEAARCIKDDDRAFAKLLQEQERAFFMLQQGDDDNRLLEQGEAELAGDAAESGQSEPCDDEEFARRLQEEERALYHQQMFGTPTADDEHCETSGDGEEEEDGTDALNYEDLQALGEFAGTVSKGLPAAAIAQLPVATYGQVQGADDRPDKCCICQVEYEVDDEVKLLPCQHFFHVECVNQWLSLQKVCLLCNKEIPNSTGS